MFKVMLRAVDGPEFFGPARSNVWPGLLYLVEVSVRPGLFEFLSAWPVVCRLFLVKKTNQTSKMLFHI